MSGARARGRANGRGKAGRATARDGLKCGLRLDSEDDAFSCFASGHGGAIEAVAFVEDEARDVKATAIGSAGEVVDDLRSPCASVGGGRRQFKDILGCAGAVAGGGERGVEIAGFIEDHAPLGTEAVSVVAVEGEKKGFGPSPASHRGRRELEDCTVAIDISAVGSGPVQAAVVKHHQIGSQSIAVAVDEGMDDLEGP